MHKYQLNFKLIPGLLLPGLLALGACTSDPVTNVSQGNLDQLALPGKSSSSSTGTTTPVVLSPTASSSPTTATTSNQVRNLLAWQVRPSGQTSPVSYLVGTVHAPFDASYKLPAAFSQQMAASKAFYMEADVDQLSGLMASIVQQAVDKNQNLQTQLGSSYWAKLKSRLSEIKLTVPDQALNLFKPWYINLMISSGSDDSATAADSIMDLVLRSNAVKGGLTVKYLELAADQLNGLQAISADEYIRLIKKNLDDGLKAMAADETKVFSIYNSGDLTALDKASDDARLESAEFFDRMVKARNQNWIKTLIPVLKTQANVVAVGSLHMAGPDGLVQQLKAQGFDVNPVSFK